MKVLLNLTSLRKLCMCIWKNNNSRKRLITEITNLTDIRYHKLKRCKVFLKNHQEFIKMMKPNIKKSYLSLLVCVF